MLCLEVWAAMGWRKFITLVVMRMACGPSPRISIQADIGAGLRTIEYSVNA